MFDAKTLFKSRLTEHLKLLNRYLRYIFNGHFMIALIFMIVTVSIYYQQWLQTITDPFLPSIFMAILFGVVVSYNPLQFFLKEPDKVFIIVKEVEMQPYFRRGLIYNYLFQLYLIILVAAAIGPMYQHLYADKESSYYFFIIFLMLLLKGWNMWMNWYMMRIHNAKVRQGDKLIRTLLSMAIFYFLLIGKGFIVFIVLYFLNLIAHILQARKQAGLAWDVLIENDSHRLAQFYRFVSMFADVPQLANRLKPRKLLTNILNKSIPFAHRNTFDYLFKLSFIRSGDYLNMYVRLIVLGGLFIFFVENNWLQIIFALLFLYMAIFQMTSLYYHHETNMWIDLYPVAEQLKEKSYLAFSSFLTYLQIIIFAVLFFLLQEFTAGLLFVVAGILFHVIFHRAYVAKKINT